MLIGLIYVAVEAVLILTPYGDKIDTVGSMVLSELMIIVPCLLVFAFAHEGPVEVFALKGIKPGTIPFIIIATVLLFPLTSCLNMSTLFFTENRAGEIFVQLSDVPSWMFVAFAAVAGPIFEELAFRGIIYRGLRKDGSALQAILISALLFGLFHMNLNQMVYATALGILFALLRETTGSVLASMIAHMTVNSEGVLSLVLSGMEAEEVEEAEQLLTTDLLSQALALMLVIALFGTALALGMVIYIAKREGKLDRLEGVLINAKNEHGCVMNVPMIIGSAISVACIVLLLVLQFLKDKA